jgi:hydroxymethylpyrimidine/phosphomethylpyrimidine kinase
VKGRVLVVAGSDSGGGAGIQADIKAITALGGYAATAITALTAQNTQGVHGVHVVPPAFLRQQMECVLADIGADAIKIGMLATPDTVELVADVLAPHAGTPLVLDPVMVAKGGAHLLAAEAVATIKRRLLPLATLITPNLPEAEVLAGMSIPDETAMRHAAEALLTLGVPAVLLKGGHLSGPMVQDILVSDEGMDIFTSPRQFTRDTHGTGCTLASAIAAGLAQGYTLRDAVGRARAYLQAAIAGAPGYGSGHGPLNHAVTVDSTRFG